MSAQPKRPSIDFGMEAACYALDGRPAFQVNPLLKTPMVKHGHHAATTDVDVIRRWWARSPNAMIGVPTGAESGFFTLDVDPKNGGTASLAALESKYGALPQSARAQTGTGGLHISFKWPHGLALANRAKDIADGLDIRGGRADGSSSGYIVVPPSRRADGRSYRWLTVGEFGAIVDAPRWLLFLGAFNKRRREALADLGIVGPEGFGDIPISEWQAKAIELLRPKREIVSARITDETQETIRKYIAKAVADEGEALRNAVEGERDTLLNTSALLTNALIKGGLAYGVDTLEAMHDSLCLAAADMLDLGGDDWLEKAREKLERTYAVAEARPLSHIVPSTAEEDFESVPMDGIQAERPQAPAKKPAPVFEAKPFKLPDPKDIEPRCWLYGRHYSRKYLGATIATGGVGKSSLLLVEALAMATGRDLLGVKPAQRCRVLYWCGEDDYEELERRITAACLHYEITADELNGWLFVNSGRDSPITIMTETKSGTVVQPVRNELLRTIQRNKIDVVQIDPFVESHQVNESDNNKIAAVAAEWRSIAHEGNCAIDIAHHTRKNGGQEATAEDARGASALQGAVRMMRVLNVMTEAEGSLAGVEDHRLYFRVGSVKSSMAPPGAKATWRRHVSVSLGNDRPGLAADLAGVTEAWEFPSDETIAASVPDNALELVKIALGDQVWRASSQSPEWVGHPIAGALGLPTDKARRRLNVLIDDWVKRGILVAAEVQTADYKKKPGYRFSATYDSASGG
jgi:hypothetical protein